MQNAGRFLLHASMRAPHFVLMFVAIIGGTMTALSQDSTKPASLYDVTMKNIDGKDVPLSSYRGKVLLLVNVASRCGYTPQYSGLESLYEKYKGQGFMVLGFPANNFLWQEPGSDEEIKTFCTTKYHVTFDMFSKISVKGKDQHPLYALLTSDAVYGGGVKWNFQKYLVDKQGKVIGRFLPDVEPDAKELPAAIEAALR